MGDALAMPMTVISDEKCSLTGPLLACARYDTALGGPGFDMGPGGPVSIGKLQAILRGEPTNSARIACPCVVATGLLSCGATSASVRIILSNAS